MSSIQWRFLFENLNRSINLIEGSNQAWKSLNTEFGFFHKLKVTLCTYVRFQNSVGIKSGSLLVFTWGLLKFSPEIELSIWTVSYPAFVTIILSSCLTQNILWVRWFWHISCLWAMKKYNTYKAVKTKIIVTSAPLYSFVACLYWMLK